MGNESLSDPGVSPYARGPAPGLLGQFSPLTILVDPPAVASPPVDARIVALLRKARQFGVTSFDVAASSNPARAERLIALAFPDPDPAIVAMIGRSVDTLSREGGLEHGAGSTTDLAAELARSIDRSRRRLAPVRVGVIEWTREEGAVASIFPILEEVEDENPKTPSPAWSLQISSADAALPDLGPRVNLFSGSFSILDPNLGSRFESSGAPGGALLIARDPFSEGRLDGSRFNARTVLAGPSSPPVDMRRLHQEFDPVLRLGFLTSGHRRTLAQAALRYVLHWPWVITAVIPLPEPERLEEILDYRSTPALSGDELEHIRRLK